MSKEKNLYFEPEEFFAEVVSTHGGDRDDYTFHIKMCVFYEGLYWTITDSGSSYPPPFYGFTPMDLIGGWRGEDIRLHPKSFRDAITAHHERKKRETKVVHTKKSKRNR